MSPGGQFRKPAKLVWKPLPSRPRSSGPMTSCLHSGLGKAERRKGLLVPCLTSSSLFQKDSGSFFAATIPRAKGTSPESAPGSPS